MLLFLLYSHANIYLENEPRRKKMIAITITEINPAWDLTNRIMQMVKETTCPNLSIRDIVVNYPNRNDVVELGEPIDIEVFTREPGSQEKYQSLAEKLVVEIFALYPLSQVSCIIHKGKKEIARYSSTMFPEAVHAAE